MKYTIFFIPIVVVLYSFSLKQDNSLEKFRFSSEKRFQLETGKKIHESHCKICHELKDPSKYTKIKMESIVPKMVKRVNKKKGHFISIEEEKILLEYLVSKSKK